MDLKRNLIRLVSNTNLRFKAVEEKGNKFLVLGALKCTVRGAIIGGTIGYYLSGGNDDLTRLGMFFGFIVDAMQHVRRFSTLEKMYKESPAEYAQIKDKYRRRGLVD